MTRGPMPSAAEMLEAAVADLTLERDSVDGDGDYAAGLRAGLTVALDRLGESLENLRLIADEHVPGRTYEL